MKITEILTYEQKYLNELKAGILQLSKEQVLERGADFHFKYAILRSLMVYGLMLEVEGVQQAILNLKKRIGANGSIIEEIHTNWLNEDDTTFNAEGLINYMGVSIGAD